MPEGADEEREESAGVPTRGRRLERIPVVVRLRVPVRAPGVSARPFGPLLLCSLSWDRVRGGAERGRRDTHGFIVRVVDFDLDADRGSLEDTV